MQGIPKLIKDFSKRFDEPHEKLVNILVSVIIFSFIYYALYIQNARHFKHDIKNVRYEHFLWYSLTLNFTIPFGDIYPESGEAKLLTSMQAIFFWFIMLA
jgi:hypothetical protein